MRIIVIALVILLIQGCSVNYSATPVKLEKINSSLCIVESPDVRKEFLSAYVDQLHLRNINTKILPHSASLDSCELTSTYIGKWSWDFVPYMATAEIKIYEGGILIAKTDYSAPRAGFSLTTEIYDDTEKKISLMLDRLFKGN